MFSDVCGQSSCNVWVDEFIAFDVLALLAPKSPSSWTHIAKLSHLPSAQFFPVYPWMQEQVKSFNLSEQIPPFSHGDDWQSSISGSEKSSIPCKAPIHVCGARHFNCFWNTALIIVVSSHGKSRLYKLSSHKICWKFYETSGILKKKTV